MKLIKPQGLNQGFTVYTLVLCDCALASQACHNSRTHMLIHGLVAGMGSFECPKMNSSNNNIVDL